MAFAARAPAALLAPLLLGFTLDNSLVPRDEIQSGGPPKDGIPALRAPKVVSSADADFLRDEDLVVGFQQGDDARAYPLKVLNWHEVVNDTVGGRGVAITWCPLTASAVVFDRAAGDDTLTFGVSGLLYQGNVLVYDHQTESLWSQLGQRSVAGKRAGRALAALPAEVTSWGAWRAAHPKTRVVSTNTGHQRDYETDPYDQYHRSTGLMFPPKRHDARLRDKEKIFGLTIADASTAYPLEALAKVGSTVDEVGGRRVRITHDSGADATRAVDASSGELLPGTTSYWFAWSAFHPGTSVWQPSQD